MIRSALDFDYGWFKQLFESSPDPSWIIEGNRFVECNNAAVSALGYSTREEFLNVHPSKLSPPRQPDGEDSFAKAERMMAIAKDKGLHRFEWTHTRADSSNFIAEVTLSAIELQHRQVIYCVWRDISERKQMEVMLGESEARFRKMFEYNDSIMMLIDPASGEIADANAAASRFYGYPIERLKTMRIDQINTLSPSEIAEKRVLASHHECNYFVFPHRTASGEVRTVEVRSSPIEVDSRVLLFSIVHDITERKSADDALQASEVRFRNILESIPSVAVQGYGQDGTTNYWNLASEHLYGYTAKEAIGRNLLDLIIPPELREGVQAAIRQMFETGQPIPASELSLMRKDGSRVAVFSSHTYVHVPGKNPEMFCLDVDLTERKQAGKELTNSRSHYQGILHNMLDAYWRVDDNGRIVEANLAISKMHGYSVEELLQMSVSDFEVIESAEDTRKHIEKIKREGHDLFESKHRCKDGRIIDLEISLNVSLDEPGNVDAFHRDITERKRNERLLQENHAQLLYLLETSPIAVRIASAAGKVIFANKRFAEMHDTTPDKLVGFGTRQYYADPQEYDDILQQLDSGKSVVNKLIHLHLEENESSWVYATYFPIDYQGEPAVLGWFYDVTELRHANEELQLASLVYQNSSEAMMVTDAKSNIIAINHAFTELTGYTSEEAIGKNTRLLNSGRHDQAFFQAMWQDLATSGHWQGEIWNRRKSGEVYPEWLSINTIRNPDGTIHRYVALFSDITEKKQSDELIWQQANFDILTGLPNRRMFHDRLEQELKKAHRAELPLALLFLDLDRFKEVNDTLGHGMGDLLLQEAAQRITGCVRETDTVARLGGDEFTLILGELDDPGSVERIAQNILGRLTEPFQLEKEVVYVSASIGITLYPSDAEDIDTLLKHADQAMYAAKQQGRNRFSYFTPSMQKAAESRMILAGNLRQALEAGQFELYYQPIVELATGAIQKAEALLRWKHPTRGFISPAEFISIAEETGLINDIGDWVFQEAAQEVKQLRTLHDPTFQISINKSPVQFYSQPLTHAAWFDYLKQLGLPGQSIVVEITEGLLLDANAAVYEQLLEFRDQGLQVSLDDFGTGYSSLSYLKKFDIDYIKIDQSFTQNLAPGAADFALCEAIVVMAHKLSLKVIAEGVETEQQRDLLLQVGCDYGQGYLFSRPVPDEEFEKLLAKG